MNINLKKIVLQCVKTMLFVFILQVMCVAQANQIDFNFDSLFPKTWYQKGLESTMRAWYTIIQVFEHDGQTDKKQLSFDDALLGRLAFGQFCIESMRNQEEQPVEEDITYFMIVVRKIQDLLAMMVVTPIVHDHIDCMASMLEKMHKTLAPLYIPSDIEAIRATNNISIECPFAGKLEIIKKTNAVSCS